MADLNRGLVARDKNGLPFADLRIDAAYGELFIDDNTGFVSGSDPTAEKIDATPVKVGRLNNVSADAAERSATTSGQLTIQRQGDYHVYCSGQVLLTGAADTLVVEVYKNGAVVADAAGFPGGSISVAMVAVGAAAEGFSLSGVLPDLKIGDTVDWRVTGTGSTTVTIKKARFGIRQISDADSPVFA